VAGANGANVTLQGGAGGTGSTTGSYGNVLLAAAGGKVGIGNSNPQQALDVTGSVSNLTTTSTALTVVGSVSTGSSSNPQSIYVVGNYAYTANNGNSTVSVINISNPASPKVIGSVGTGASPYAIYVSGRYAYTANTGNNTISVIDISGTETTSLVAHGAQIGNLQVLNDINVGGQISLQGGLNVGAGGITSAGSIATAGTISAVAGISSAGNINVAQGQTYQYAGVQVLQAQPTNSNYYFGNSGNLTGTGTFNVATGPGALGSITNASHNAAFGNSALQVTTTGSNNAAFGDASLASNLGGNQNVAVGSGALQNNTSASNNVAIGFDSGYNNTTTGNQLFVNNIAQGTYANDQAYSLLYGNFSGASGSLSGQQLTVNGAFNVKGGLATFNNGINVATGQTYQYAGTNVISAQPSSDNFYFGRSGSLSGTGTDNYALGGLTSNVGAITLQNITTGSNNLALGSSVLINLSTGSNNTAIGQRALSNYGNGSSNVAIGYCAGAYTGINSNELFIGNQCYAGANTDQRADLIYGQFYGSSSGPQVTVNGSFNVNNFGGNGNLVVKQGSLCVGNGVSSGNGSCTGASTAGTIYANSTSVAQGDYAESYLSTNLNLQAGTLVTADSEVAGNMIAETGTAYDSELTGVVSTAAGVVIGNADTANPPANEKAYPIALNGRVPVLVTDENGPIQPGDYLTSSASMPGYAMKATHAGTVIGQALGSFSSSSSGAQSQTINGVTFETGTVSLFVHVGYQNINNTFVFGADDLTVAQAAAQVGSGNSATTQGTTQTGSLASASTSASFIIRQNPTGTASLGNILQLQSGSAVRLMVASDGATAINAQTTNANENLVVVNNNGSQLFSIDASGNVQISATLVVKKDVVALGEVLGTSAILARNGDSTDLHQGDLVMLQSAQDSPIPGNGNPLLVVVKANASSVAAAQSATVVGIVDRDLSDFNIPGAPSETSTDKTDVPQQDYLDIVTGGTFEELNVDASQGAINVGDKLTISGNAGYARKMQANEVGTMPLVGVALDALASGTGHIRVYLMLNGAVATTPVTNTTTVYQQVSSGGSTSTPSALSSTSPSTSTDTSTPTSTSSDGSSTDSSSSAPTTAPSTTPDSTGSSAGQ
jgi:hypothetical protein